MKPTTRAFLVELHQLMEKYDVDFNVVEVYKGHRGFDVDGLEIGIVDPDEGYSEYVTMSGKYFNCKDIEELLNDK